MRISSTNTALLSLSALCLLQACSSQQLYNSAQSARQNECLKIIDSAEMQRCMAAANKDYDQYSKEVESVKK